MNTPQLSQAPARSDIASRLLSSDELRWRCIGPPRGGRVVAVAGDPADPMTFYFGACAGGVWKATDGGIYWECVSDGFFGSASVGALAVADSDPNVIYAGMGETTIRIDVSYGDGVYKSDDAGKTWRHMGLSETRHIGEIRVNPQNPDIVYVAAFGHAFGPNPERGVYRSLNGGETWDLVLHESDRAGAIDIVIDPDNPRILFASTWEAHRNFWTLSSGGPGSKLFRSTDGGDSWHEVSTKPGFAKGLLGKIGVAIAPRAGRVWALVEAKGDEAGLYRSDDGGETWRNICPNRDLLHRPWYYTHVFADPVDAETVYVNNLQMWKSTDGGKDFHEITTPHGDNHDLWIDPRNNRRMVQGNDGGANVSFNGGLTWSTIYNQMTAQFYRMDVDDQFPYRVYATQQDNTSISVPNATEWGVIRFGDCTLPGTGESGFIAVHPDDPNIVFIGAVGSSPGGTGALQRYDHRTRQMQLVNVWPEENTGIAPRDLRYRFAWTFPILFSPHDSGVLYAGGNHVFRSLDEGHSWEVISPDLSRNDPEKLGVSGGPLTGDSAGAEIYASLSTLVESPHKEGELWAGTDDGLVHVSRDGGAKWENVTPPEMPEWAYIGSIEASAHDPEVIYVAATCFKLDDYKPYLYRTGDGGRSWATLSRNFPRGEITRVLRADPEQPGLLFVGTETGVFASFNDGADWTRMRGGLPVVPIYDLKLKHGDLIAATHGRSFWVLDDLSALRGGELASDPAGAAGPAVAVFEPRATHRLTLAWSVGLADGDGINYGPAFGMDGSSYDVTDPDGRVRRKYLDVGENPPRGVIISYWLDTVPDTSISLTITDSDGREIRRFSSDVDEKPAQRLPMQTGYNRFVWDMTYPPAEPFDQSLVTRKYEPFAKATEGSGPVASPGTYGLQLSAGSVECQATATILKDPRLSTTQDAFNQQFELARRLTDTRSALRCCVNHLRRLRLRLEDLLARLPVQTDALPRQIAVINNKLAGIEGALVNVHRETPRDDLRHPAGLDDTLGELLQVVAMADAAPVTQVVEVSEEVMGKISNHLGAFDTIVVSEIAELNDAAKAAGISVISA
jgi:photosystem II stability/assembly factor-like uncharacterized protein